MKKQPSPRKKTCFDLGSCCRHHQQSSRAHGARGSPDPPWPFGEHRARSELNKGCDPEPSRIGAEVCSPSTVSLCRMQLLEARLVPFRRWGLGVSLHSWLLGGLLGPVQTMPFHEHQPYPRRRTRLELISSSGHHQPSRSAHGARGSPDPPWPYGEHRDM